MMPNVRSWCCGGDVLDKDISTFAWLITCLWRCLTNGSCGMHMYQSIECEGLCMASGSPSLWNAIATLVGCAILRLHPPLPLTSNFRFVPLLTQGTNKRRRGIGMRQTHIVGASFVHGDCVDLPWGDATPVSISITILISTIRMIH